jgi:hypothetical protein
LPKYAADLRQFREEIWLEACKAAELSLHSGICEIK